MRLVAGEYHHMFKEPSLGPRARGPFTLGS